MIKDVFTKMFTVGSVGGGIVMGQGILSWGESGLTLISGGLIVGGFIFSVTLHYFDCK